MGVASGRPLISALMNWRADSVDDALIAWVVFAGGNATVDVVVLGAEVCVVDVGAEEVVTIGVNVVWATVGLTPLALQAVTNGNRMKVATTVHLVMSAYSPTERLKRRTNS
jgi:hypothetical protein